MTQVDFLNKSQLIMNSQNAVYDALKMVGRKYKDEAIKIDEQYWPFKVANDHGKLKIKMEYYGEYKIISMLKKSLL